MEQMSHIQVHVFLQLRGKSDVRIAELALKISREHFLLKPGLTLSQVLDRVIHSQDPCHLSSINPAHRGMSCALVVKGDAGLLWQVVNSLGNV